VTAYSYIPLAALGLLLLAPVEKARPFLDAHRDDLVGEFGKAAIDDLETALEGDLDAARRFAEEIVPGASLVLKPHDRQGYTAVEYSAADGGISGRMSSPREAPARLFAAAAIELWYKLAHPRAA